MKKMPALVICLFIFSTPSFAVPTHESPDMREFPMNGDSLINIPFAFLFNSASMCNSLQRFQKTSSVSQPAKWESESAPLKKSGLYLYSGKGCRSHGAIHEISVTGKTTNKNFDVLLVSSDDIKMLTTTHLFDAQSTLRALAPNASGELSGYLLLPTNHDLYKKDVVDYFFQKNLGTIVGMLSPDGNGFLNPDPIPLSHWMDDLPLDAASAHIIFAVKEGPPTVSPAVKIPPAPPTTNPPVLTPPPLPQTLPPAQAPAPIKKIEPPPPSTVQATPVFPGSETGITKDWGISTGLDFDEAHIQKFTRAHQPLEPFPQELHSTNPNIHFVMIYVKGGKTVKLADINRYFVENEHRQVVALWLDDVDGFIETKMRPSSEVATLSSKSYPEKNVAVLVLRDM